MEPDPTPRRPRIVLIVDNHVTVDSRVQKTARAAAEAGYDARIIGRSTNGERYDTLVGGVPTTLLGAPRHLAAHQIREPHKGRRPFAYRSREEALDRSRKLQSTRSGQLAEILELKADASVPARARSFWKRGKVSLRQRLHSRRYRAFQANADDAANNRGWFRGPRTWVGLRVMPGRTWRRVGAELLDYDLSFGNELTELAPDLIHAHDYPMLVAATNAKARAAQAGRSLAVVHDVHEWILGVSRRDPHWRHAMHLAEVELIPRADAVITVSDWLADSVQRDCRLAERPIIITNSPELPSPTTARLAPSVRDRCGLAEGVPLMVYSGALAAARGVGTVVDALPLLPDVHLAVVTGKGKNLHYDELLEMAEAAGTADRVHRVDYVPQELVVPHLASADIGLIPITHALNHEISLITKYREYMHARLPIVVSDVRTMAEFTREHGTGEVFVEGDPADLARAVRAVLADPERYRSAYTDDLLAEHSWPVQAARLVDVYAGLVGQAPPVGPPVPTPPFLLPPATAPVRLVIGPTNMAGQGHAWARAVEVNLDGVDACTTTRMRPGVLQFPTDLRIGETERIDPVWIERLDVEVDATRTHALLENALPVDASSSKPIVAAHRIERMQAAGLALAFAFHGSEVRDPRIHAELYPWSNFRDADPEWRAALEHRVDEVRAVREAFDLPSFVSTPDQLTYVPGATWLPTVVDAPRYASTAPVLLDAVPVVLHAPSRAATKGSAAIDAVLQRLEDQGLVVYRRLTGVRPERMPREIGRVDVVVEQVGLGLYGVLATEALAAGRLVVGQVGDVVRDHVRSSTGLDVPILEAGADALEEVLRGVLADREAARAVAAQGPGYVRDVHDGRRSAAVLAPWLGVATP